MKPSLVLVAWLCLATTALPALAADTPSGAQIALTLEQAEAHLLEHNRDLQSARRALESAQAAGLAAAARPNPQVSINSVSINPSRLGSGSLADKRIDTALRVDQLIERGDKRALRMRSAQHFEQAAGADLLDVLRQQRVALYATYYDLLYAQEKARLTEEAAQLAATAQQKAELRLKAGDLAASEVARIRVDMLRADNDARQALADVANARQALAYLIGMDAEAARLRATSGWPASSDAGTAQDSEEIIARRPDVRAALVRIEAARGLRDLARAQRSRDISVGAQLEHYPSGTDNSIGVGVSFPLFLGNHFEGNIRAAEVALDAAQDTLERTRAQAMGELVRARNAVQASSARLQRYQDGLLPAARRALDAAEFAFAHGAISAVELIDARRTWRAIQLEALAAQADYARALAAWRINTQIAKE